VVVPAQQMMNKDQLKVAAAKAKETSGAEGGECSYLCAVLCCPVMGCDVM